MASATGIPSQNPAVSQEEDREPLLGRPGDISQTEGKSFSYNFITGTAVLAQAGIWILTVSVWYKVLSANFILFSYHPLANAAGILLVTQGILVLQPTHTQAQKKTGANIHAILNGIAALLLIGGAAIIEYNKFSHDAPHFTSVHGKLGLITYIFLILQSLIGLTMYYLPALYGGVSNAKSIWKYHRMSGYILLVLFFGTVAAATQTDTNFNMLHIKLWAVLVSSGLVLAGVFPRLKKSKLGL